MFGLPTKRARRSKEEKKSNLHLATEGRQSVWSSGVGGVGMWAS